MESAEELYIRLTELKKWLEYYENQFKKTGREYYKKKIEEYEDKIATRLGPTSNIPNSVCDPSDLVSEDTNKLKLQSGGFTDALKGKPSESWIKAFQRVKGNLKEFKEQKEKDGPK